MGLKVFAAGSNAHGQLANETLEDSHILQPCAFACENCSIQYLLPGDTVVSIDGGANHTLLLLQTANKDPQKQLWGCGDGRRGQLGPAYLRHSAQNHSIFRRIDQDILDSVDIRQDAYMITSIAASWESSHVVLRPQQGPSQSRMDIILSMGGNDFQDLGVASPSGSEQNDGPHRVALEAALKPFSVTGYEVTDIAASTHHVVAMIRLIFDYGVEYVLVGWGACRHGQLGIDLQFPTKNQSTTPPRIISTGFMSSDVPLDGVTSFALGNHHTVVLHSSGRVSGFGSNKKGQLTGIGSEMDAQRVRCTWDGTYLVFERNSNPREWEVRATGSYHKGQLGYMPVSTPPVGPRTVSFPFSDATHRLVNIVCGSEHVLALFDVSENGEREGDNSQVWGWGWNEHGNLAISPSSPTHFPRRIWPQGTQTQSGKCVVGIWAGCATSWIVESQ